MLELQRRQNELSCKLLTLIVFTLVNIILFYNFVVVPFIYWLKPMGILVIILQPSILFPLIDRLSINKEPLMPPRYLTNIKNK